MKFILPVALLAMFAAHGVAQPLPEPPPTGEKAVPQRVPNPDKEALLNADELLYMFEGDNRRVIARGNAELLFQKHTIVADEITYDEKANTLVAKGNVRHGRPDGSSVHADVLEAPPEIRDAFLKILHPATKPR